VGGYGCDFGKDRGLFAKIAVTGSVLTITVSVDRSMARIWTVQIKSNGARRPREGVAAGEAVDWRCGPGPRVHGAPITQRRRVTRSGPSVSRFAAEVLHKRRDDTSGGARRCFTGVSPTTIQNGLQGTVLSMEGVYTERGTRRIYLDGRRGGSSGHGGSLRKGAAAFTPARKRKRGGAVCARQLEGRSSSPRCDTSREENNDGKATTVQIDDEHLQAALREQRQGLRGAARPGDGEGPGTQRGHG
jgi:hypothetical protein